MGEVSYGEKARAWLNKARPFLLILSLQFGSAGMYIITMDALQKGMSNYVFIVYRNIIAVISLGPFAVVLERKIRPKMTPRIFAEIMTLAFLEIVIDQCFTLLGMKLTSASYTSAIMNTVPSITFVLAVIFRLEPLKIKEIQCQAKVIGTLISFGGALLMALYKGPIVNVMGSSGSHVGHPNNVNDPTGSQWAMGTFFLLIGGAAFSCFYILQAITLKKYPAEMSLSTWICFAGAFQSLGVAVYAERRHPYTWYLSWDSKLVAPIYSGIISSGIQYYVQGLVMRTTGPVFVTAFNPLRMIIVTALACTILSEQLHLGSIIGAVVVAVGLYLVVWGKSKEHKARAQMPPFPAKEINCQGQDQQLPITAPRNDTNNNNNDKAHPVTIDNNGDKNSDVVARN